MLYTEEYKKMQEKFHVERPDYGISGSKYVEHVLRLAEKLKTRDILDFGAGKCHLQKGIPYPIQNYDPFIPEIAKEPIPADIVVCTDVMEHIEPECLENVLKQLKSLTKKVIFLDVATRPAVKFLPDGRNTHLIQESINWWLPKLMEHFDLQMVQNFGGEFIFVGLVLPKPNGEGT